MKKTLLRLSALAFLLMGADAERWGVADVLTCIRNNFKNKASAITAADVRIPGRFFNRSFCFITLMPDR